MVTPRQAVTDLLADNLPDGIVVEPYAREAPIGGAWEDGAWLDFTDPTVLSEWEARHGWVPGAGLSTNSTATAFWRRD